MKILRWIVAIVVSGFLLGALASAVVPLLASEALTALPALHKVSGPLSQRILGPLGTVLLAAIYLCRDFLPERRGVSFLTAQEPSLTVQASSPEKSVAKTAVGPKFELESVAQEPEPESASLEEMVRSIIASEPSPSEYSAQRFFITDSTGNRRGVMGVSEDGSPLLALFASEGDGGFVLSEAQGAPTMGFYDSNGQLRARLSLGGGTPRLTLNDDDGKQRIGLSILSDGSPYFFVGGKDGTLRLAFAQATNGQVEPPASDQHDESRNQPPSAPNGDPTLIFDGRAGRPLLSVDGPSGRERSKTAT